MKNEVKQNKNLSANEKKIINGSRVREWGKDEKKRFDRDYEPLTRWFFIKDNGKILAFGGLRPIKVSYLGKNYSILGICSIISVVKGKGYGTHLISAMIKYSKKTGKTLLGFTTQTEFFKKAGLKTKKGLIKRFVYVNPKTKEKVIDNEGDGIYLEGKDKFISKVLKTKSIVYIDVEHW